MIQLDEHIFQMGWFNHQPGLFSSMVGLMDWIYLPIQWASVVDRVSKVYKTPPCFLFWDVWAGCPVPKWNENSDLVANGSSPKKKELVKQSFNHQWCFWRGILRRRDVMWATDSFHIPWVHPCPIQSNKALSILGGWKQGKGNWVSSPSGWLCFGKNMRPQNLVQWCFVMRKGARDDVFFPYYPPSKWHPIPRHVWRWFFPFSKMVSVSSLEGR